MANGAIYTRMPYDKRDEKDQFVKTFTDEQFLDALRTLDDPTTSAIAEEVGCKYRTSYERLKRLEDEGRVRSREVGNLFLWEIAHD